MHMKFGPGDLKCFMGCVANGDEILVRMIMVSSGRACHQVVELIKL